MNDESRPFERPRQLRHPEDTDLGRRLANVGKPPAHVIYMRAAIIAQLGRMYTDEGRPDLGALAVDLADQLEAIADRRAA